MECGQFTDPAFIKGERGPQSPLSGLKSIKCRRFLSNIPSKATWRITGSPFVSPEATRPIENFLIELRAVSNAIRVSTYTEKSYANQKNCGVWNLSHCPRWSTWPLRRKPCSMTTCSRWRIGRLSFKRKRRSMWWLQLGCIQERRLAPMCLTVCWSFSWIRTMYGHNCYVTILSLFWFPCWTQMAFTEVTTERTLRAATSTASTKTLLSSTSLPSTQHGNFSWTCTIRRSCFSTAISMPMPAKKAFFSLATPKSLKDKSNPSCLPVCGRWTTSTLTSQPATSSRRIWKGKTKEMTELARTAAGMSSFKNLSYHTATPWRLITQGQRRTQRSSKKVPFL